MLPILSILLLALTTSFSSIDALLIDVEKRADYTITCSTIAQETGSETKVYYPGSAQYEADNNHFAPTSSEVSACSVEPATLEDVGRILAIVGREETPFAVRSGGHSMNPHFSSTPGVQIAMSQFNGTAFDAKTQTAVIGTGQLWTDVFAALEPYNVSVPGVRIPGVGVGGYLLGGGYAFQTSEYGLGFDSVLSFELVKPDGQAINVTARSNPDLFFGLKGGFNNFGIVTRLLMKTYPQTAIWGGNIVFGESEIDAVSVALADFNAKNTDPKMALNVIFQNSPAGGPGVLANLFYNAPTPPPGLFDVFLTIPAVSSTISTRSLLSLVEEIQFPVAARTVWDHVPVEGYPILLVKEFVKESSVMTNLLTSTSVNYVFYFCEVFTPGLLDHAEPLKGFPTPSAWPPQRDVALMPSLIWVGWNESKDDTLIQNAIRASGLRLREKAATLGQDAADPASAKTSKYPNYAAFWTTAQEIFGSNLPILQQIKKAHDPKNVMGLAGGFKI